MILSWRPRSARRNGRSRRKPNRSGSAKPPPKPRHVSQHRAEGRVLGKRAATAPAARAAAPERDELEDYLLEPLETDMDLDLLAYWKLKESKWPT